jgi:hypothetical protein
VGADRHRRGGREQRPPNHGGADAAEGGGEPGEEAAEQFRVFLERDPDWPLLFYEFWSLSVRNPELQDELAKRRDAIRDALADTLERVADELGFELRFPAPALATAIAASLNGLAFERSADPDALPDEVFTEFITAVLGCAISAPTRGSARLTDRSRKCSLTVRENLPNRWADRACRPDAAGDLRAPRRSSLCRG